MNGSQSSAPARLRGGGRTFALALVALAAAASWSGAQEPAACLSFDPAQWPAPAKPYFMVIADTSDSMATFVAAPNTCGLPMDRLGHLRCALQQVFRTYEGPAHFGLATFAATQFNCSGACYTNCLYVGFPSDTGGQGCGPGSGATRQGANIVVPLRQDNFWDSPPAASNEADLLSWVDNACGDNAELFAAGLTPLNGALRDMYRYLSGSWTRPDGGPTYTSPLSSLDRPCRPVHVILVTDSEESCDTSAAAVAAATALHAGVPAFGLTWYVSVHVIYIGGSTAPTSLDNIAAAGGTTVAVEATDEAQLLAALRAIISPTLAGESCDNKDNNCNGCTDEGYRHFGDLGQTCCAWSLPVQREDCLSNYRASIRPASPQGDRSLLPCTTAAQAADPGLWLCYDPGETCDNLDNNVNGLTDEGMAKCGSPLHCPQTEVCNGQDDDCDGGVDEGGVCGSCVWSPEVCDGCDNDCDGMADDGVAAVPCGLASPPNCAGTMTCKDPQAVAVGGCVAGRGWNACANNPQTETCDGVDNDCDGIIDDGVASVPCVPAGTPPGLVYGGNSQCRKGQLACGSGACTGFVGPSAEVCDGIDNDCDGMVDEASFGVGTPCGINHAPCTPGVTACVAGALVCQGGVGPQPETCDGIDNNCNGTIDELPLTDAPPAGQNGCWSLPGSCCSFHGLSWCPPAGATCTGNGSLASPCNHGTLVCTGGAWRCDPWEEPSAESCNGIDDDCNGLVDDGANLCPAGRSCQSGACR